MKTRMRMWLAPRPIAESIAAAFGFKIPVPWFDFEVSPSDAATITQNRGIRYVRYDGQPVPFQDEPKATTEALPQP